MTRRSFLCSIHSFDFYSSVEKNLPQVGNPASESQSYNLIHAIG